ADAVDAPARPAANATASAGANRRGGIFSIGVQQLLGRDARPVRASTRGGSLSGRSRRNKRRLPTSNKALTSQQRDRNTKSALSGETHAQSPLVRRATGSRRERRGGACLDLPGPLQGAPVALGDRHVDAQRARLLDR